MTREFPQLNSAEPIPSVVCVYGVLGANACPFPVPSASVPLTSAFCRPCHGGSRRQNVSLPSRELVPKGGAGLSVRVFKSAFLPCHRVKMDIPKPETTRNPSATRLRFQISLSSIDPCPPFHAKRTDKAGHNLRLKTDRRFSRQSRPLARLVQDDGRRKLRQIKKSSRSDFNRVRWSVVVFVVVVVGGFANKTEL